MKRIISLSLIVLSIFSPTHTRVQLMRTVQKTTQAYKEAGIQTLHKASQTYREAVDKTAQKAASITKKAAFVGGFGTLAMMTFLNHRHMQKGEEPLNSLNGFIEEAHDTIDTTRTNIKEFPNNIEQQFDSFVTIITQAQTNALEKLTSFKIILKQHLESRKQEITKIQKNIKAFFSSSDQNKKD